MRMEPKNMGQNEKPTRNWTERLVQSMFFFPNLTGLQKIGVSRFLTAKSRRSKELPTLVHGSVFFDKHFSGLSVGFMEKRSICSHRYCFHERFCQLAPTLFDREPALPVCIGPKTEPHTFYLRLKWHPSPKSS